MAVAGEPEGDAAQALVREIRERPAPYPLLVGGAAAEFVDQQDAIGSNLPLARRPARRADASRCCG